MKAVTSIPSNLFQKLFDFIGLLTGIWMGK